MLGSDHSLSRSKQPPTWQEQLQYGGFPPGADVTQDAIAHTLATGLQAADPRYNMEQLDKPGVSRGKGQQYLAAQAGILALAKAQGQAARTRLADSIAMGGQQSGLLSGLLN